MVFGFLNTLNHSMVALKHLLASEPLLTGVSEENISHLLGE